MASESSSIKVINKGTPFKPRYIYFSNGEEIPMGTSKMYNKFVTNFSDPDTASSFFSKKEGIEMLNTILTSEKCPLFLESEMNDSNYIEDIKKTFGIIQRFTSGLSSNGKTKEIHNKYVDMIKKIQEKIKKSSILEGTVIPSLLVEICNSLSSAQRSIVRDVTQIIQSKGSIESAKNQISNSSVIDRISKLFLSPIDSSVFHMIREYCIQYIGEGKKVSEESGHNLDVLKTNLLLTVGLFRQNLIYNGKPVVSFNANNMGDINTILSLFLTQPDKARLFIKIMQKMTKFYNDLDEDIASLNEVFVENCSFEFTPYLPYIPGVKDPSISGPKDRPYISGSKDRPSTIKRTITKTKDVEEVEILKPVQAPRGFFTSEDSSSDSDSSSESEDESYKRVQDMKISSNNKSNKKKYIKITEVVSEDIVNIPLKAIKSSLYLLNEGLNALSSQDNKKKALEILKSIEDGTFGDVKADLILDWWQDLFLEKVKNGESFVLVGDTSGGKTFISLMAMRILFNQYINETKAKFIYMAPTPQLAVLQFANILTSYPNYSHFFGICCKSIVDIPSTARILIGTPNEIKKYLTEITYHRETIVTLDNLKDKMENAIKNPFVENCRTLFIDEIQTWSPTYVQDIEVEQIMECKAIEEVITCVNFDKDDKSQVIGMSATLSPESINNIKNRISEMTHIENVTDIIYTHEDIGLTDLSKKDTYIPIMKKPEIIAVKIEGSSLRTFRSPVIEDDKVVTQGEPIYEQVLDSHATEIIVRDAEGKGVLPIAFFRESELATIQMYKDYIDHLERKNLECRIWHTLHKRYNDDVNSIGYNKMKETAQVDKWIDILYENIVSVMSDINAEPIVNISRFAPYIQLIQNDFGRVKSINYSPELYGLIVEYNAFKSNLIPFSREIHPFYRFGSVVNANNFFSLEDSSKKVDTVLKKILLAQDADPSSNTGSIIPLIMRGIEYGCGILTSSIPLGFQLEIYKFINIKSKSDGSPIPILFCEYGMSMGMNTSIMSVCMCRLILMLIGASEFKQTGGRPGRRGNSNSRAPIIYTFNISNTYLINRFEVLDFNVNNISSNFFLPSEVHDYLARIIVKYENNKSAIIEKSTSVIDSIISGDTFKGLGGSDVLLVRKIQISKYQIRELFNTVRNINPTIANSILRPMFNYLQRAEFYSLNVQIR